MWKHRQAAGWSRRRGRLGVRSGHIGFLESLGRCSWFLVNPRDRLQGNPASRLVHFVSDTRPRHVIAQLLSSSLSLAFVHPIFLPSTLLHRVSPCSLSLTAVRVDNLPTPRLPVLFSSLPLHALLFVLTFSMIRLSSLFFSYPFAVISLRQPSTDSLLSTFDEKRKIRVFRTRSLLPLTRSGLLTGSRVTVRISLVTIAVGKKRRPCEPFKLWEGRGHPNRLALSRLRVIVIVLPALLGIARMRVPTPRICQERRSKARCELAWLAEITILIDTIGRRELADE